MMTTFTTAHGYKARYQVWLMACLTLVLSNCGLELTSRSVLNTPIDAVPTPTPTATTTTPDNGPTAAITGTMNGQAVMFSYVLLNTDSSGHTALEFLSYDPCLWVESHSASTFPQDFNTLIVSLVNTNAAPGPGVYIDVAGTNNTSGMSIDPNSSFGSITACKGSWTGLDAGTTVTINSINIPQSTAAGSLSALLSGGGILSGTFSTTTCNSVATTNFASNDSAACSALQ
jgi:hypothetical protein